LIACPDQFHFMPRLPLNLVCWHHVHYFHVV
jgi:hypothetical protein